MQLLRYLMVQLQYRHKILLLIFGPCLFFKWLVLFTIQANLNELNKYKVVPYTQKDTHNKFVKFDHQFWSIQVIFTAFWMEFVKKDRKINRNCLHSFLYASVILLVNQWLILYILYICIERETQIDAGKFLWCIYFSDGLCVVLQSQQVARVASQNYQQYY